MSRMEIIGTGLGGQGIQLMMRSLALAINNIKHLGAFTADYGAAARGEKSSAYVVIKEHVNDWPEVMDSNVLIALSQKGFDAWIEKVQPNAMIFFDPVLVKLEKQINESDENDKRIYYEIPATEIARELKDGRVVNMAMLGGVIAITNLVSESAIIQVLKKQRKYSKNNEKAIQQGYHKVHKIELRVKN